jgi:hypothetical protein
MRYLVHSAAICCTLVLWLPLSAQAASDAVVARRIQAFYEVYTGRKVTRAEVDRMTEELIAFQASNGKTGAAIRAGSEGFFTNMLILREDPEGAAAIHRRHFLIEVTYFDSRLRDMLEVQLLQEPDPVRVVDRRSKRLMTERDVVALANIRNFATSQSAPQHKAMNRQQIDRLVAVLNETASNGSMPRFFSDAAAFWAGVRQQWPYFSEQQKQLTRAYSRDTWRVSMPTDMYGSLWGLDAQGQLARWTNDVSTRIAGRPDVSTSSRKLQQALNSAFDRD